MNFQWHNRTIREPRQPGHYLVWLWYPDTATMAYWNGSAWDAPATPTHWAEIRPPTNADQEARRLGITRLAEGLR